MADFFTPGAKLMSMYGLGGKPPGPKYQNIKKSKNQNISPQGPGLKLKPEW